MTQLAKQGAAGESVTGMELVTTPAMRLHAQPGPQARASTLHPAETTSSARSNPPCMIDSMATSATAGLGW